MPQAFAITRGIAVRSLLSRAVKFCVSSAVFIWTLVAHTAIPEATITAHPFFTGKLFEVIKSGRDSLEPRLLIHSRHLARIDDRADHIRGNVYDGRLHKEPGASGLRVEKYLPLAACRFLTAATRG